METEREKHVYLAKLSEQTERYDGMNRFRSFSTVPTKKNEQTKCVRSSDPFFFAPMNIFVRLVLFLHTLRDLSSLGCYLI